MASEYQIVEKMATGGFSTVFKVCRVRDDNICVMKRIPLNEFGEQQRLAAAQEICVMRSLHHPFIVEQRDAFLFNEVDLCIVMDFYDGGDLDAIITRQRERDEYLSLDCAMMWFVDLCFALHYLHSKGVVHRDMKTHNVFLDLQTGDVAIGDFGVAEFVGADHSLTPPALQQFFLSRSESEAPATTDGANGSGPFGAAVRGTPLYMSPEAIERGECSPASDVWSLGCILYELLTLRHPFESRDMAALVMRVTRGTRDPLPPHYPNDVSALVDAMLAHNPEERPNCADILRVPIVAAFVSKLLARRVPRGAPASEAESAWTAQLHALDLRGEQEEEEEEEKEGQGDKHKNNRGTSAESNGGDAAGTGATASFSKVPEVPPSREQAISKVRDEQENKLCAGPSQGMRGTTESSGTAVDVEDMRYRSLDEISAEVAHYRQIVQNEMRALEQRRQAAAHEQRFGNRPECGAFYNTCVRRAGRRKRTKAENKMIELHNGWNGHSPDMEEGLEASLAQRRMLRTAEAVHVLGDSAFARVYDYYRRVELIERDVGLVMQFVPDRTQWFVLPLVEEIVVIDRIIARAAEECKSNKHNREENGGVA